MSDTNRINLAYIQETTFGTPEPGNPAFQNIRFTSESLHQETGTVTSAEIRSDRNIPDVIRTGLSAAGDVAFEFSFAAFDDWLVASMLDDTATPWPGTETVIAAADVAVTVTAATATFTHATGWDNTPTANEWVEIRGFATNTTNNGYFKVTGTPTTTVFTVEDPGDLVDDATGDSVNITELVSITNGTLFRSYNIEREYTDLTNQFALETGMAIDQVSMAAASDQIVTGTFGFIGKNEDRLTATTGTAPNDAAPGNDIMNGVDNIPVFRQNLSQFDITNLTSQLQNNLRARLQIGTLGAISVGTGNVNMSGTIQAYFENGNADILDAYHDFTDEPLAWVYEDAAGNGYVFDVPSTRITNAQAVATGQNDDVLADLQWQAKLDATEAITLRIARFTSTSA